MRKLKLYFSLLKERDWLEEMARKGWILSDLTLGILYTFQKCEPCEKVYEIDRFALPFSGNATREELTARQTALDVAAQSGWEIVTHDEMLNYYFIKDRAGDESDELYDDEDMRRLRAESYRKHLAIEQPKMLLVMTAALSVIYLALFFMLREDAAFPVLAVIFTACVLFEMVCCLLSIACGQQLYQDMFLSRAEWEQRKRYAEKKSFPRIGALLEYLAGKDAQGLRFCGCDEQGNYLFEPSEQHYRYYADTKQALAKRLRRDGKQQPREKRDIAQLATTWHECSMREASQLGLEAVCCIMGTTIVYRRDQSLPAVTWDTGAAAGGHSRIRTLLLVLLISCVVGFFCGVFAAWMGL